MNTANETNVLELDDAAIMSMSSPPAPSATATTGEEAATAVVTDPTTVTPAADETQTATETQTTDDGTTQAAATTPPAAATGAVGADNVQTASAGTEPNGAAAGGDGTESGTSTAGVDGVKPAATGAAATAATTPVATTPVAPKLPTTDAEFAEVGRALLAPFKANNKEFQPQSVEEARKLMQMGANYTKKMQQLQPAQRVLTMLSNNGLMDEGKLAFLIDLDKKNPQAIQKLLADSQFDPLTADKDAAASYTPGNHQVTDVEVQFATVLDEVASSPTGPELITEVQTQWDGASKQALFQNPAILQQISEHRASGLYAVIHAEVERQRTLGQIPVGTPFLQAYKAMGDMLHATGRLKPTEAQTAVVPAVAVETRVATPPAQVANSDKAKAAASTKSTTTATQTQVNYLDQPDDDFVKQVGGRL